MYLSIEEFIDKAEKQEKISDLMIEQEMERSQKAMKKFGHRWVKIWMSWIFAVKRSQEGAGVFLLLG